jgi:hypothetical protein
LLVSQLQANDSKSAFFYKNTQLLVSQLQANDSKSAFFYKNTQLLVSQLQANDLFSVFLQKNTQTNQWGFFCLKLYKKNNFTLNFHFNASQII